MSWLEEMRFQDFFGQENLATIFLGGLIEVGIFWGVQRFVVLKIPRIPSAQFYEQSTTKLVLFCWKFLRFGNSTWDFFGF